MREALSRPRLGGLIVMLALAALATACGRDQPQYAQVQTEANNASDNNSADNNTPGLNNIGPNNNTPDEPDVPPDEPDVPPDEPDVPPDVPDVNNTPLPTEERADGAACTSAADCAGGTCLGEDDGFFEGMCTTLRCDTRADCTGENTACLQAGRPNYCIQLCESNADCREGYLCQAVQGGGYCTPNPTAGTFVPGEGDLPFEVVCGETLVERDAYQGGFDRHVMSFSLPEDTTSFMVIPYSPSGQIYPVELSGPGGTLDLFGEYDFALANASFLINLSPLLVPQAPQFASYATGGDYTITVAAEENLCRYVLAKSGTGTQVDLNIHLVGAGGITAASAPNNSDLQAALEEFSGIYAQLGVSIGAVRYRDLDRDQITRFRIVRTEEAAFQLVAQSEPPGDSPDEHLSINVFFVDDFAIDGGSVLGISAGLPGAAGLHGTRASGLVFSAAVLEEPTLLGQVLSHEVGHYLGLFHSSEQGGQGFDPLDDTPECSGRAWRDPESCPDINNLMFPFAGLEHQTLSPAQQAVLQANPLIK